MHVELYQMSFLYLGQGSRGFFCFVVIWGVILMEEGNIKSKLHRQPSPAGVLSDKDCRCLPW